MFNLALKSVSVALVAFLCAPTACEAQEPQLRGLRVMVDANFQAAMLQAVNTERAAQGKAAFCNNMKLQTAAQLHSEDQAKTNVMSHTGSDGSSMSGRIKAQGFAGSSTAENVAAGQTSVEAVMKTWMNSPGHKANILGNYNFFGVGYAFNAQGTYKHFWTQDFGSGSSEACDGGASASTPAPVTKAPVAAMTPVTQAPVYTNPPATRAPVAQTQAPATNGPVTTTPPVTSAPAYTNKPVVTRTPHSRRPATTKKTDCKPIY